MNKSSHAKTPTQIDLQSFFYEQGQRSLGSATASEVSDVEVRKAGAKRTAAIAGALVLGLAGLIGYGPGLADTALNHVFPPPQLQPSNNPPHTETGVPVLDPITLQPPTTVK